MTTQEQIPVIQAVLEKEKWLLGERIGYDPTPTHPELLKIVCKWVLEHGEELRKQPL